MILSEGINFGDSMSNVVYVTITRKSTEIMPLENSPTGSKSSRYKSSLSNLNRKSSGPEVQPRRSLEYSLGDCEVRSRDSQGNPVKTLEYSLGNFNDISDEVLSPLGSLRLGTQDDVPLIFKQNFLGSRSPIELPIKSLVVNV
jgi:hypothetical protein